MNSIVFEPVNIPAPPANSDERMERLHSLLPWDLWHEARRDGVHQLIEVYNKALRSYPASTRPFHHFYPGGMLDHIIEILEAGRLLSNHVGRPDLWPSLALVLLVHDWSKLTQYRLKDADRYEWEKVSDWQELISPENLVLYLASLYELDLTLSEVAAILSHEGGWSENMRSRRDMDELGTLTHCADMLSAKIIGRTPAARRVES